MKALIAAGVIAVLAAACDDDTSFSRDSGSGSNTLYVYADIEGKAGSSTHMYVEVALNGNDVSGASVVVDSDLGEVTLTETGDGYYEAEQSGFAPGYHLRVESGENNLKASLNAPKAHSIKNPEQGATYDTQDGDLEVSWSPTGADEARVETDEVELDFNGDPGAATIPATSFEGDEDEVEVKRTNKMQLAGGTTGSGFEISYEVQHEITVLNPYD